MSSAAAISVLLADDHPVVRAGLRALLAGDDIVIVGEAASERAAIAAARRLAPDVVVLDIDLGGVAAIRALVLMHVRVIVLTTFEGAADEARVLQAGAAACVRKDAPRELLVDAVRSAARK